MIEFQGLYKGFDGEAVLSAEPGPEPEPEPTGEEFSVDASLDGNTYTVTGMSETTTVTAVEITPEEFVTVEVEGAGEVELTLYVSSDVRDTDFTVKLIDV